MTRDELEERVRFLEDYKSIWQVQSTYAQYWLLGWVGKMAELFAKKTPGVEVEISNKGVWVGSDAPQRYFGGRAEEPQAPGWMVWHLDVNPVIQINKDGTRAKGVWLSPGLGTIPIKGKLTATWMWGKYDMEYVKEDGEWKMLKLRWLQTLMTPYDSGWVKDSMDSLQTAGAPVPDKPSAPGYYDPYQPDKVNVFGPPPPEPYEE
jgi:hypothetical protein